MSIRSIPLTLCFLTAAAQEPQKNPLSADAAALAAGAKLYVARCSVCHGSDARGGQGPDLSKSRIVVFGADRALFNVIRDGIPGTEMPPFPLKDDEIWKVVSFVHSIARPGTGPPVAGDPEAGRRVFTERRCIGCHMVLGKGGTLGPDLSGIALRRFANQIRQSVLDPAAEIDPAFQTVTVTLAGNRKVTGALKNEDNYSLQILLADGGYSLMLRREVQKVDYERRSLMPDVAKQLSGEELQNLLAFLDRQRNVVFSVDIPSVY